MFFLGIILFRNGATSSRRHCDAAKYIGISEKSFKCGSYRQVVKKCNVKNPWYLTISREKFGNGEVTL